ncbi:hypothetical protein, partial [Oceanobacillus damuensis]|uniref:hypothetical protein n=1 Tax=Oceanobacillus damuensis TaxID=937928 RepID=UPI001F1F2418
SRIGRCGWITSFLRIILKAEATLGAEAGYYGTPMRNLFLSVRTYLVVWFSFERANLSICTLKTK